MSMQGVRCHHQYRTFEHLFTIEEKKGDSSYVVKVFDIFHTLIFKKRFSDNSTEIRSKITFGKESILQLLKQVLPQEYLSKIEDKSTNQECCDDIYRLINQYKSKVIVEPQDLKDWVCPIAMELFHDPVDDERGHTFEKAAIEEYLKTSNKCPLGREPIASASFRPNRRVREEIEKRRENPIPNFSLFEEEKADMALSYIEMAKSFTKKKEYKEALVNYRQAFRFTRNLADYAELPLLFEKMQEAEKATLAWLYLAQYQLENGKNSETILTLEKCSHNNELALKIKMLQSKICELKGRKESLLQLPIQELEELSKQDLQNAIYLFKKILEQAPEQLELYSLLANLLKDPIEKVHTLLKGATHAIAVQDYNMARKLCEELEGSSFEDALVFLEIYENKQDPSIIKEKFLSTASVFQERKMFRDLLRISKLLYQNNPIVEYCEKIVTAYEKLEKPKKQHKWIIILLSLLIKEKNWQEAEEVANQSLLWCGEIEKIALYEKLETIYSNLEDHKLSNLLGMLGKAYLKNSQLEAAEKTYQKAFKVFHRFEHIIGLAETLKEKGEVKLSVKAFYEASSIALFDKNYQNLSLCVEKIQSIDFNMLELSQNQKMHLLAQIHILNLSAKVEVLEETIQIEKNKLKCFYEKVDKKTFSIQESSIDNVKISSPPAEAEILQKASPKVGRNEPDYVFGKAEWEKYFGNIGGEPNIWLGSEMLNRPCPFNPHKLMRETHFFFFIPKKVNGEPLTIKHFYNLVQDCKQSFGTENVSTISIEGEIDPRHTVGFSGWVTITKDFIPLRTELLRRPISYTLSRKRLENTDYRIPNTFVAVLGMILYKLKTGRRLCEGYFLETQSSFTRERVEFVGFSGDKLFITANRRSFLADVGVIGERIAENG